MVGRSLSSLSFTWTRKSLKIHSLPIFRDLGVGWLNPDQDEFHYSLSTCISPGHWSLFWLKEEGDSLFFYFLRWEGETEWMERASYLFPPDPLYSVDDCWENGWGENDWGFLMRGLEILGLPGPTAGSLWSRAERHFFHHPEKQRSCGSLRTRGFGLWERVAQYEHWYILDGLINTANSFTASEAMVMSKGCCKKIAEGIQLVSSWVSWEHIKHCLKTFRHSDRFSDDFFFFVVCRC